MGEEISEGDESGSSDKSREVEVHLYIKGEGPIHVFKSPLRGWDQDRLDLRQIMEDYALKALHAYSIGSGRGLHLRFNPRTGLSLLPYSGKVICIDGEPKDSLIRPISKVLWMLALVTFLVAIVWREPPQWINKLKFLRGSSFAWGVAIVIFVFSRLRKRTRHIFRRYGW